MGSVELKAIRMIFLDCCDNNLISLPWRSKISESWQLCVEDLATFQDDLKSNGWLRGIAYGSYLALNLAGTLLVNRVHGPFSLMPPQFRKQGESHQ